jgi:hypothetical protein
VDALEALLDEREPRLRLRPELALAVFGYFPRINVVGRTWRSRRGK